MPVSLDNLPQPRPLITPPRWWVWLIVSLCCLLLDSLLTIALWQGPTHQLAFWYYALVLPCFIALFLCLGRWAFYQAKQLWVIGWNDNCQFIRGQELIRGKRHAYLLWHETSSIAGDTTALVTAVQKKQSLFSAKESQQNFFALNDKTTPVARFEQAFSLLQKNLIKQLDTLPDEIVRYTSWQLQVPNLSLLPKIDKSNKLTGQGLLAFDNWLDITADTPSVLVVVGCHCYGQAIDNSSESLAIILFANQAALPLLQSLPLANVYRPHLEPIKTLARAVEYSLIWADKPATAIKEGWLQGDNQVDEQWTNAISAQEGQLKEGETLWLMDKVIGNTGYNGPWLTLSCLAEQAQQSQRPQWFFSHQPHAVWAGIVSPYHQETIVSGLKLTYAMRTQFANGPLALLKLHGFRMPNRVFLSN